MVTVMVTVMATAKPKYGNLNLNMGDAPPGARLYLQMSGGLDSSYLAWRLLRDGYKLLVWHCSFRTHQQRWPHEDAAYNSIIDWLRSQGLTDFEELPQGVYSAGGAIDGWRLDYTFLWPEAGHHLRLYDHRRPQRKLTNGREHIRHIVIPDHAESISVDRPPLRNAYEIMCKWADRRIARLHPMSKYDRFQILADMPPELIEMCWWCRKPKDGQPCHACSTCKVVDPALEHIGYVGSGKAE